MDTKYNKYTVLCLGFNACKSQNTVASVLTSLQSELRKDTFSQNRVDNNDAQLQNNATNNRHPRNVQHPRQVQNIQNQLPITSNIGALSSNRSPHRSESLNGTRMLLNPLAQPFIPRCALAAHHPWRPVGHEEASLFLPTDDDPDLEDVHQGDDQEQQDYVMNLDDAVLVFEDGFELKSQEVDLLPGSSTLMRENVVNDGQIDDRNNLQNTLEHDSVSSMNVEIKEKDSLDVPREDENRREFILCLQEPNIAHKRLTNCSKLQTFFDQSADRPRTAIAASRGLTMWLVPEFTAADITTVVAKFPDKEIFFSSVYCDIALPVISDLFSKLARYCKRHNRELFISADSNSHSLLYGHDENRRGVDFESFIFENHFHLLNEGRPSTWHRGEHETAIDVMLHSHGLDGHFHNWRVLKDLYTGSDHYCLAVELNMKLPERQKKLVLSKANWPIFTSKVEAKVPDASSDFIWNRERLQKESKAFTSDVISALHASCPVQRAPPTVPSYRWWNPELDRLKKAARRAQSRQRERKNSIVRQQALKDARKQYYDAIKKHKKNGWNFFLDEATDSKKVALINRIVYKRTNASLGLLREEPTGPFLDPEGSLELLADTHFSGSTDRDLVIAKMPCDECDLNDPRVQFITQKKVKEAIKTFGNFKAAGCDEIKPIVLKNLGPKNLIRLMYMFRASFLLGYQPIEWRESRAIFIPKPHKKDYTSARSFRPITLGSFVAKAFERILLWRLNETIFAVRPLSQDQHAFRNHRSTETALSNAVERLESTFQKGHFALAVFLDIQGAFDNVSIEAILDGLKYKGVDDTFLTWYEYYLRHRKVHIAHKGAKMVRWLTKGTPQGGVLSPVMWNVTFDSFLCQYQDDTDFSVVGFADDAQLLVTGPDPDVLKMFMQSALDRAVAWGQSVGLEFSASKTTAVLFTRRNKYTLPPQLTLNGQDIPYSDTVRYLGVIFDVRLYWQAHFDNKLKAAKGHLLKVRQCMGKLTGIRPLMMRWLYTGIVRASFLFGSIIWAKVCETQKNKRRLSELNRLALTGLGCFRRGTPTAGLEVITFLPPLHLVVKAEATLAVIRTQGTALGLVQENKRKNKMSPKMTGHRHYVMDDIKAAGLDKVESDPIPLHWLWDKDYTVNDSSFDSPSGVPKAATGSIGVFTDGSSVLGMAGSGFVAQGPDLEHSESHHLGHNCSVFQAEIHAIFKAATWLVSATISGEQVSFHVDNQAALLALKSPHTDSQMVLNTMIILNELASDNTVTLHWVKAHAGHAGNEEADRLAKLGAQSPNLAGQHIAMSARTSRNLIIAKMHERWNQEWQVRTDCRQTKHWFQAIDKCKALDIMKNSSRRLLSGLVQLLTGHNFLRRHEAKVNNSQDTQAALCRFCDWGEKETTEHIIGRCPVFVLQRLEHFDSIIMEPPFTWQLSHLLSYLRSTKLEHLFVPGLQEPEDDGTSY